MIEIIRHLLTLSEEDGIIRQLQLKHNSIPSRVEDAQVRQTEAKGEAETILRGIEELQQRKEQLEREADEIRAATGKSQSKRARVKTNREYWALMKEVEDLKTGLKQKEDEILLVMEQLESLETGRREATARIEEAEKDYQTLISSLKAEEMDSAREIEKRLEHRNRLIQSISQEVLQRYERLAKARAGEALAGVREGICTACHLQLPPQKYNELIRNDQLMTCPNCQRIIYWLDHEELTEYVKHK